MDFGVSPTHAKIHVGDLLLDYGTRRETKSHGKHGHAVTHKRSKQEVHDEMLTTLGIHVNEPRAGTTYVINSSTHFLRVAPYTVLITISIKMMAVL